VNALAALPKARFDRADADAFRKVRAMIVRGKTDAFISDYLGMDLGQVGRIREKARPGTIGRPRLRSEAHHVTAYDGSLAPTMDKRVVDMDRSAAERGSTDLLRALLAYGARRGLPNMAQDECLRRLAALDRLGLVRAEELVLADKVARELQQPSPLAWIDCQ
jgi:hypothetical protein